MNQLSFAKLLLKERVASHFDFVELEAVTKRLQNTLDAANLQQTSRIATHRFLQANICQIAGDFHLIGVREFKIGPIGHKRRNGYLDVVWLRRGTPVAAFEIDSSRRQKSLTKLLAMVVPHRFWIYYGARDVHSFVSSQDPEGNIRYVTQVRWR